jgi:hypothetical protein
MTPSHELVCELDSWFDKLINRENMIRFGADCGGNEAGLRRLIGTSRRHYFDPT